MGRSFEILAAVLLGLLIFTEVSNHASAQRLRRTEPERREPRQQVRTQSLRERPVERFVF